MAEKADELNGIIVPFVTSDDWLCPSSNLLTPPPPTPRIRGKVQNSGPFPNPLGLNPPPPPLKTPRRY